MGTTEGAGGNDEQLSPLLKLPAEPSATHQAALEYVFEVVESWERGETPMEAIVRLRLGFDLWVAAYYTRPRSERHERLMAFLDAHIAVSSAGGVWAGAGVNQGQWWSEEEIERHGGLLNANPLPGEPALVWPMGHTWARRPEGEGDPGEIGHYIYPAVVPRERPRREPEPEWSQVPDPAEDELFDA